MAITGPSINVDQNTTRGQLQAFLDNHTQGGDRILGKKDAATGVTILYVSQSKADLLDRMIGRAADRRSDAREAVMQVFDKHSTKLSAGGLSAEGASVKKFLFTKISERMHAHDSSALRSGEVRQALIDVREVGKVLPKVTLVQSAPSPGPTVLDTGLGIQDFQALGTAIAAAPPADADGGLSDALRQIAENLGDRIATTFSQAHAGAGERENFAVSDGAGLRTQLSKVLSTVLPKDKCSPEMTQNFAAAVFDRAAAQVSPDKVVAGADKMLPGSTIELPTITIGGKTYEPERFLGVGGFAKVYEYKSTTDDTRIAFKIPNSGQDRAETDATTNLVAGEVKAHRAAQGGGNVNVVDLKGVVRMNDGRIGMALELAPSGDVHGMTQKISDAVGTGPGKITQEQADVLRLTLVKDMAQGLNHIRNQNMIHLDFKTPNVIIGSDGRAKVADFGTTQAGADIRALDAPSVDNPIYQSPERIYVKERIRNTRDHADKQIVRKQEWIAEGMKNVFTGATKSQIKSICNNILTNQASQIRADAEAANAGLRVANAADTWALGIATANLYIGDFNPGGSTFFSRVENDLIAFGQNPNGAALAPRQADGSLAPGSLAGETHSAPVTALINKMMSPDPADRPSLADILNSGPLNGRGVGGDQAHALIAALAGGDAGQIDVIKGRLAARLQ